MLKSPCLNVSDTEAAIAGYKLAMRKTFWKALAELVIHSINYWKEAIFFIIALSSVTVFAWCEHKLSVDTYAGRSVTLLKNIAVTSIFLRLSVHFLKPAIGKTIDFGVWLCARIRNLKRLKRQAIRLRFRTQGGRIPQGTWYLTPRGIKYRRPSVQRAAVNKDCFEQSAAKI